MIRQNHFLSGRFSCFYHSINIDKVVCLRTELKSTVVNMTERSVSCQTNVDSFTFQMTVYGATFSLLLNFFAAMTMQKIGKRIILGKIAKWCLSFLEREAAMLGWLTN